MSSIGPQLPPHLLHLQSSNDNDSEDDSTSNVDENETGPVAGPEIPAELLKSRTSGPIGPSSAEITAPSDAGIVDDADDDEDDYTPALPPDMLPSRPGPGPSGSASKKVLGPSLPPSHPAYRQMREDEDSDEDDVGPMPLPSGLASSVQAEDGVKKFLEIEERRRKRVEEAAKPKALKREEWMLVPPSSSDLLGTLDPTKLSKPRQFSRSTQPPKTSSTVSTLWTETPAERQQRLADEVSGRKRRAVDAAHNPGDAGDDLEAKKKRKVDEEIRRGVHEHTVRTRGAALVDAHVSNKSKSKAGGEDEEEGPPVIWDHARDMAVSGRLMGDKERDKMIRDARALGDRFGTGTSGGFL